MKHLYLILAFFFVSLSYGQAPKEKTGDIEGFKLYPNPVTNGRVTITTSLNAPKTILIFDVFGSKILETTIIGTELNVNELVAGVYILRVTEKNKTISRKLIVK
ncbi:T9SS type A sorting domain-containing protein [Arenibacter sp. 6A1]|uniref:T9SS type A sorting domain-containing protein n=1 Tax=Arenibacter sp. 6A1 TaxID=2720391 RepID=UPI00144511A5|nr:T9SS type A sorting domain-containing protein [Arenibacter sp. 6A1]NKI26141.1 T9SS type A sorting domain-containing protein [Arenibacter sp. 6A1]